MDKIEYLRQKLHKVIESGDHNAILTVSQELDVLIVRHMINQLHLSK
ncbi:MAG TPA: Spo0E family sporulation regulatory protein-aspartic acid phosphatase [Hungateiclostridium thermocellum]|nr:aspartyl-phosphate phosphatase Spo0E family protein [Acetivibrio thermocellus]THJ76848.1 aspartyl-phosphate phosphatase Spo0E family protein [Acetivibrio thermocellus]UWV45870.1 aspartyl-phosphate phosphatase Spo0E family protein [Acetivibrio thermocellus]HBW26111.1 Spo0E family sporulation regulatory protein-aspartic acid phosphatase [Acetivibrio thermocellus]HOP94141.1 aspartyl-phosphate phosphatase Spo0E family protein [Acetivibrio thermocellus]